MMEAIPEGVGLGVPGELAPNRVGDGSDKLPTQSEVCTQDTGKILRLFLGLDMSHSNWSTRDMFPT